MFVFIKQILYQIHTTPLIQTSQDQSDFRWTIHEYDKMSIKWPTSDE